MTAPLRIIMLSYERDFLNPASEASQRLQRLATDGVSVTALLLSDVKTPQTLVLNETTTVIACSGNAIARLWKLFFVAVKEIRAAKKRDECVLVSSQEPFIAGLMAFKLSRLFDVPYEIQEHGDFFSGFWSLENYFNHVMARIGKFVLRRADVVRVVSERVRSRMIDSFKIDPDRIYIKSVWSDLTWHFSRIARPWPETPVITVPCRFVKQKGLDVCVNALAMLAKEGVAFRVRLVGSGPLESVIRDQIQRSGLADRVTIEPWASQEALWGNADLFVCSSRYEGWGRTIIEAMASGVPIVTTDVGCVGSILRPHIDGIVVPPNDPVALAQGIRQVLTDPDHGAQMATKARDQVRARTLPPAQSTITQHETWNRMLLAQDQRGPARLKNRATESHRAWFSTTMLIAFATVIRAISFVLFWKTLGTDREWGFFTIVQNWFMGYGYSFVSAVGCPSAYRSPGYLFFLTAVYGIFGFANFFAQALIQNFFAVLLVYLVYRLGWSITKDRRVGLIAGLLISLHPYTFYHYTQYYHTVLSGCLLVGLLLALLALERTKRWRWAILGGVMIAGLAYIQGTILPATVLLSCWLFVRLWPDWKRAVGTIAVMAVISAGLIAPWTYRNWKVFHAFVPLTTDLGHALAKANHPLNYAMTSLGYPQEAFSETIDPSNPLMARYAPLPEVAADLKAHGVDPTAENYFFGPLQPVEPGLRQTCADQQQMNEVAFNTYWTTQAKTWIVAHYWPDVVKLQVQKIAGFWSPSLMPSQKYGAAWSFGNTGIRATLARVGLTGYVLFVELLGVIGLFVIAKKKRLTYVIPILIIFVVYTLLHSFFAGYTKYRIPLDNLLVILAAIAIIGAWDRLRKNR